jgi:anti-sigma factor RsiW
MHNCRLTRASLTDLALNDLPQQERRQLLIELNQCVECREEYESITDALHVSELALRSSVPAEGFWSGYHDRLVNRIQNRIQNPTPVPATFPISTWQRFLISMRQAASASIRVPVPVAAAAVLLLVAGATIFAWSARRQTPAKVVAVQAPTIITKTVNVPVIQEKLVTRIVYVDRNRTRSNSNNSIIEPVDLNNASTGVAQTAPETSDTTNISLVGFKPTDQVKLKIMKGSYRDEQ